MKGLRRFRLAALAALALLSMTTAANAASLQVSPILLEFPPQQPSQVLWLSNSGTTPLRAQVRVQQWTQTDNADALAPSRDLAASPPMIEIAPGQKQMVRIVLLQPTAAPQERTYRLLVDELPGNDAQNQSSGLQFLLRYSVPVFVGTPANAAPQLSARWEAGTLSIANSGQRRARLSQLVWVNADGSRVPLNSGLFGYVLAGQSMHWELPRPPGARPGGTLTAKFDNDSEERPVPLLSPVH